MKSLTVTSDFTQEFNDIIKRFRNDAVLVGVPEGADRQSDDGEGEPINNATILAINEFGSPINNIPAWPVMSIGINAVQDQIAEELKKACVNALSKGLSAVTTYYERAGLIASNSVKKTINAQVKAPELRPATIAARKHKHFSGTKRLIVTGQLRNSITYVVNPGGF